MTKRHQRTSIRGSLGAMTTVGVAALLLASCSGGTKNASSSTTVAAVSGGGTAVTTTTESLGSGGGSFCDAARQLQKDQEAFTNQAAAAGAAAGQSGNSQSAQAAGYAAALQSAKDSENEYPKLISLAPGSLKSDLETVWNSSKPMLDAVIQANGDMSKIPPGVQQSASAAMADPKFAAAGQALENYGVQQCGFPSTTTLAGQ